MTKEEAIKKLNSVFNIYYETSAEAADAVLQVIFRVVPQENQEEVWLFTLENYHRRPKKENKQIGREIPREQWNELIKKYGVALTRKVKEIGELTSSSEQAKLSWQLVTEKKEYDERVFTAAAVLFSDFVPILPWDKVWRLSEAEYRELFQKMKEGNIFHKVIRVGKEALSFEGRLKHLSDLGSFFFYYLNQLKTDEEKIIFLVYIFSSATQLSAERAVNEVMEGISRVGQIIPSSFN